MTSDEEMKPLNFVSVELIYFNYSYTAEVSFFIKSTLHFYLSSYR